MEQEQEQEQPLSKYTDELEKILVAMCHLDEQSNGILVAAFANSFEKFAIANIQKILMDYAIYKGIPIRQISCSVKRRAITLFFKNINTKSSTEMFMFLFNYFY